MLKSSHPNVVIAIINVINEVLINEGGMAINSKIIIYLLNKIKEFNNYGASLITELVLKFTPSEEEMITIMNILD